MRYVKIPPAVMHKGQRFDLAALVAQVVMGDPRWRDEWAERWEEAEPQLRALSDALPSTWVKITDEAHECIAASCKAAVVPGELVPVAMPFFHAITRAAREKPPELVALEKEAFDRAARVAS